MRYCYKCPACKEYFDRTKSMTDDSPELCDDCGVPMDRIITGGNFILKGEGFHSNDYKS